MLAFAASRPGAWLFSKLLHQLDDAVGRLSVGKHSVPGLLAGLPVVDVVARPATEAEFDEVMAASASIYGGYRKYRTWITGRRVRIFVLEPV